jgi:hypothetical protein
MKATSPGPTWLPFAGQLILLVLVVLEYLLLYRLVPPRHQVESHWGSNGVNWFGQAPPLTFLYAAVTLALLCLLRYFITIRSRTAAEAWVWHVMFVASLLPCGWLLVVIDWDNEAVAPIANWVGTPIMLFFVPTMVLCFDLATGTRLRPGTYWARGLLEVIVLVPAWAIFWAYFEFLVLGWFWI